MIVNKIHKMAWGDELKTTVMLIADTNTGLNEVIGTPYSEESIIWEAVKIFPIEEIEDYVPQVILQESIDLIQNS